jgi:uncharacterized membrane protein YfcA
MLMLQQLTDLLVEATARIDPNGWALLVLTGVSKAGLFGIATVMTPVMAYEFGGKDSTGLMLPMLLVADVFAVFWYRQHTAWPYLLKLMPGSLAGVLLGTWLGNHVDDHAFKLIMGGIIILSVGIMVWRDYKKIIQVPDNPVFEHSLALLAGFTSMVGNLAGAVVGLYFLIIRMPKFVFIGTGAWYYLMINAVKMPLHVAVWETVTIPSLLVNLLLLPAVAIGAYIGWKVTPLIPDAVYRKFVIIITFLSAAFLFR